MVWISLWKIRLSRASELKDNYLSKHCCFSASKVRFERRERVMNIEFCGATSGVTGSCHLISTENHKLLLDCGQFQGGKKMDAMNREDFPFDPADVDCMILSHAHIDHCGRIPLLVKRGFKGDIFCTDATADLLKIMLEDSGYIHEKEAEWQNRKNERAGKPFVEPLYTVEDAQKSLKYIKPVMYDELVKVNDEMRIVFNEAGHILGSAITEVFVTENEGTENENVSKIVFSGDLGVTERPILRNPKTIKSADYLIMESTYGNRVHPPNATSTEKLLDIVIKTIKRGGNVIIPSFAVGRTQELIFEFNRIYEYNEKYRRELENIDVYVDSPMATTATEIFRENAHVFDDEMRSYLAKGDDPLVFKNLKFTKSTQESTWLNSDKKPKVIISASGMCEAGRIKHHLKHNLWDPKSSIIFVGFQAEGTLGKRIIEGAEYVNLFGEQINVAAEIYNLEGFSGHADREGLLNWLKGFKSEPKKIFLVHGENQSKKDFSQYINDKLGYHPIVITEHSEFLLEKDTVVKKEEMIRESLKDTDVYGQLAEKISGLKSNMEGLLYNTGLAIKDEKDMKKLAEINNALLQLEKSAVQLGAKIAR